MRCGREWDGGEDGVLEVRDEAMLPVEAREECGDIRRWVSGADDGEG
jgi:hypothetical protein